MFGIRFLVHDFSPEATTVGASQHEDVASCKYLPVALYFKHAVTTQSVFKEVKGFFVNRETRENALLSFVIRDWGPPLLPRFRRSVFFASMCPNIPVLWCQFLFLLAAYM